MVNVSDKERTHRFARARGAIKMQAATLTAIRENTLKKGDALSVAKIAGVMAAKRTSDLVPLCHPLMLTDVQITLELDSDLPGVRVEATAETTGETGVEMEAIVGVSVTLITLYDMAKAIDKEMELDQITLIEKRGGRSGHWVKP